MVVDRLRHNFMASWRRRWFRATLSLWFADSNQIVSALQQAGVGCNHGNHMPPRNTTVVAAFAVPLRSVVRRMQVHAWRTQAVGRQAPAQPLHHAAFSGCATSAWRERSACCTKRGGIMPNRRVAAPQTTVGSTNSDSAAVSHAALQRVFDGILAGDGLKDVENTLATVDESIFNQADAWKNSWVPMRSVIAETGRFAVSVLSIPRGTTLEWQRHDQAESVSSLLFGDVRVCSLELESSGICGHQEDMGALQKLFEVRKQANGGIQQHYAMVERDAARKLEQQELEATYKDAWAIGGSDESDCVCRGGRCPRMWDCPFWVDRRRAEAKGSSAHMARRVVGEEAGSNLWRAGRMTVRRIEALEPSALLEVRVGGRRSRYYREISSTVRDAAELIEVLSPVGVKPGIGRYLGPFVDIPQQQPLSPVGLADTLGTD